jgi:hypothetical protein
VISPIAMKDIKSSAWSGLWRTSAMIAHALGRRQNDWGWGLGLLTPSLRQSDRKHSTPRLSHAKHRGMRLNYIFFYAQPNASSLSSSICPQGQHLKSGLPVLTTIHDQLHTSASPSSGATGRMHSPVKQRQSSCISSAHVQK